MRRLMTILAMAALIVTLGFATIPARSSPELYGPKTPEMLVHIYLNQDAEFAALEAGEIDIVDWPLSKTWIDAWTGDPDITMRRYSEMGQREFDLNNQRWPTGVTMPRDYDSATDSYKHYQDVEVSPGVYDFASVWDEKAAEFRKALTYMTDKDRIIADVLKGYGYKMETVVPIPSLQGWTDYAMLEELGYLYPYNPTTAASVLDAAGFTKGTTSNPYWDSGLAWSAQYIRTDPKAGGADLDPLEFYIRMDDPDRVAAGEMLRDALRKAGIPINDHIIEKSVCYEKVMVEYDFHIYTGGWGLGADIDWIYWLYSAEMYFGGTETSYYGGVGWSLNYNGFCNHEFEECAMAILTNVDPALVKEAALVAQAAMCKHACYIPLWCSAGVQAYRTGWTGVVNMEGTGVANGWSFLNMDHPTDDTIDYGYKANLEGPHIICAEWTWDWDVLTRVYDSLIDLNPYNFALEIDAMAEAWSTGEWETGKMYAEFTLKEGLTWHDGNPVTPEDVQFSLEFTRDCGPGVAWNYANAMDIDHVDTQAQDGSLGARDVKVYFTYSSYWMLHWAGFLPIIQKDIWMAANDLYGWGYTPPQGGDPLPFTEWNAAAVRQYHPWEHDADGLGVDLDESGTVEADEKYDMIQDGCGPWYYTGTEKPFAISASTWVSFDAFSGSPGHFYRSQEETTTLLADWFHAVGDVDRDSDVDIVDLAMIARSLGTDRYYYEDVNTNDEYDYGEPVYDDLDASEDVSIGDIRIKHAPSPYEDGSTVQSGDDDIGTALKMKFARGTDWDQFNTDTDLNDDGAVGLFDLSALAGKNFGRVTG